jgi:hypothetical protein
MKQTLSKILAHLVAKSLQNKSQQLIEEQEKTFLKIISNGRKTRFGRDHHFDEITTISEFQSSVPIRDYEAHHPYIQKALEGETDILWPGKPVCFCKTSGTTSGVKYIPLSEDSLPRHISGARNALLSYINATGKASFVSGKMIFLQGSPKLDLLPSGIPYGRLSGIVANHVPRYLQSNRMPSFDTNCIDDWEQKLDAIVTETLMEDMRLISGIPSWVQMYFEKLLTRSGKSDVRSVFPNFNLFVFGGVQFEPYRRRFLELIGQEIPTLELYPASEGFIAFQDRPDAEGLLLNPNAGIFFEFVPIDEWGKENSRRISLKEVKLGVQYVILLTTTAGLWCYNIGDTVRFTSLQPFRIKVTGRVQHYTSAFGEHVISEEVEAAAVTMSQRGSITIHEFHVAPQVNPSAGLPYHEWIIECDGEPDISLLSALADETLSSKNIYYRDLIRGKVLRPAVITPVPKGTFNAYMKAEGKLGGQNKIPRLANHRKIADALLLSRIQ